MKTQHTAGPWKVDSKEKGYVMQDGQVIAACNNPVNASLIAAAPEMLEMLKYYHEKCECQNMPNQNCEAYELIANAEGK